MTLLLVLPPELLIHILEYLPISTVGSLAQVSHKLTEFVAVNAGTIYHLAAIYHGFVTPNIELSDIERLHSKRSLRGASSWLSFCQRRVAIERSWKGLGPSAITHHEGNGEAVHRFKIDERRGLIISTRSAGGGLIVSDLSTHQVLWSLDKSHVRNWAHCEYDNGFIIFDRPSNLKEVWRYAADFDTETPPPESEYAPDDKQWLASQKSAEKHVDTANHHFKPWALFKNPVDSRAFRFVFPTLLSAGEETATLWNVEERRLLQIISPLFEPGEPTGVTYVELSDRYVFHCSECLRIYSRASGKCVLNMPLDAAHYSNSRYAITSTPPLEHYPGCALIPQRVEKLPHVEEGNSTLYDFAMAAHVSADGRDVAILLSGSRLLVVQDYERAIAGTHALQDITLDIELGSQTAESTYLAYDQNRIAVATAHGVFVVHVKGRFGHDTDTPVVYITRAPGFGDRAALGCVSCLQMSDTGLYLNWDSVESHDIEANDQLFAESLGRAQRITGAFSTIVLEPNGTATPSGASTIFSIDCSGV